MGNKFDKRMKELSDDMEKKGRKATDSKLYRSIQEKMSNINKPIKK